MSEFSKDGVYFWPLGGADDIGMNMYVYAAGGRMIVVDAGYGFLNDSYPGMDLCYADPSGLKEYEDKIDGIFITHAHEDHFGAIAHLIKTVNKPIYASKFTLCLIKDRLAEYGLDKEVELVELKDTEVVKFETISVEAVSLVHSVPETLGLFIRTKFGNVFHATDWRFDDGKVEYLQTDYPELQKIAQEGVDMFVCDSTNVLQDEKLPTEYEVRQSLKEIIKSLKDTVVVTCFASNLMRLESLIMAADLAERTPVLVGRSLVSNMKYARQCGYFEGLPETFDINQAADVPSDKALYICTGSQANYRSALTLIANNESKAVKLDKGDTIIFSSKIIPGNEEKIERMQEKFMDMGVNVIIDEDYLVHTSGHPTKYDLKHMYELLKPKILFPVHGDKRFIRAHKKFALECRIGQVQSALCGDVYLLANGKIEYVGAEFSDIMGVDRKKSVSLTSQLIKNRRRIAYNCSVFISVVFDTKLNLEDLQISSIDILEENEFSELVAKIKEDVTKEYAARAGEWKEINNSLQDFIKAQVRKRIFSATGIKPVVFFHYYQEKGDENVL